MPLKTPWVCILYWAPQRMGVVWLSLSYPVPWLQTQRGKNKAQVGPQVPFGNAHLQQKECFLKAHRTKAIGFCVLLPPSTGATLKAGLCEGRGGGGHSTLASPPHGPPLCSGRLSAPTPLRHAGKSHNGFHPRQVVYHLASRTDGCEYLQNEQIPQASHTLSAMDFCQQRVTQFLSDSPK